MESLGCLRCCDSLGLITDYYLNLGYDVALFPIVPVADRKFEYHNTTRNRNINENRLLLASPLLSDHKLR